MLPLALGAHAVIRDKECHIRRIDPASDGGKHSTIGGMSDLVRGLVALFLGLLQDSIAILLGHAITEQMTSGQGTLGFEHRS